MGKKPDYIERRDMPSDIEARGSGKGAIIEGHAPVFNKLSRDLGGFVESVEPRAVTRTLRQDQAVGTFNHDTLMPLGTTQAGTLRMAADSQGVHYEIEVADTNLGRDVLTLAERGDITKSSFGFTIGTDDHGQRGDTWGETETGFPHRSLTAIRIFDVGPVTSPAYLDSEAMVRALAALETEHRSIDHLVSAAQDGRLQELLLRQNDDGQGHDGDDDDELDELRGDIAAALLQHDPVMRGIRVS